MRFLSAIVLVLITFSISFAQDANTLINEGIKFHDDGEYEKAIEKYLQAINLDPNNATAYYEAAFSYNLNKDYDNALKMAEKAIDLGSGGTKLMAMVVKGSALDDSGKHQESAEFYESILKDYPNEYLLLFNYGVTLAGLGRTEEAERAYMAALSNNFGHPGSHLQLGKLNKKENAKAKGSMSLYFFLMLENKTKRSLDASNALLTMIYGTESDTSKDKTIYLTLPGKNEDQSLSSAELYFGMMGAVSGEVDKKVSRTRQQRFVEDTRNYFSVLTKTNDSDSKAGKKKKKKNIAAADGNFWRDTYVSFYKKLLDAGHVEAFCYHIMVSQNDPDVSSWIESNKDQMDRFYLWLKTL
jgi:tetratricopeptide (TPR) repeat protein